MEQEVVLNGPTLTIIGTMLAPLIAAITKLFLISVERTKRAENQVDELIPLARDMVNILRTIQEDVKDNHNENRNRAE